MGDVGKLFMAAFDARFVDARSDVLPQESYPNCVISEDEYLERIVAGIHATTTEDAEVTWNEKINGRQFDVVIRFKLGTLRYLIVVEVKNRSRPASANDIEAFVTKAGDQRADKAVFVTAAGYQRGAAEVGQRHGVELFTVKFAEDEVQLFPGETVISIRSEVRDREPPTPELHIGEPTLIARIEAATLVYTDGRRQSLPTEPTQMQYYAAKTRLKSGHSVQDVIAAKIPRAPALGERLSFAADMKRPELIDPPDEFFFPRGKIVRIDCEAVGTMMRPLTGNVFVEPTSFRSPVVYTNWITGEEDRYTLDQLPLGLTDAVKGRYYFLLNPLRYYYCEKIEDDLVHWTLVESFQGDSLIRARYTQLVQYSRHYIPVAKKSILRRLQARLDDLDRLERSECASSHRC